MRSSVSHLRICCVFRGLVRYSMVREIGTGRCSDGADSDILPQLRWRMRWLALTPCAASRSQRHPLFPGREDHTAAAIHLGPHRVKQRSLPPQNGSARSGLCNTAGKEASRTGRISGCMSACALLRRRRLNSSRRWPDPWSWPALSNQQPDFPTRRRWSGFSAR